MLFNIFEYIQEPIRFMCIEILFQLFLWAKGVTYEVWNSTSRLLEVKHREEKKNSDNFILSSLCICPNVKVWCKTFELLQKKFNICSYMSCKMSMLCSTYLLECNMQCNFYNVHNYILHNCFVNKYYHLEVPFPCNL